MHIPVSEAKGQLTDLVRRAESGEEIVLTRHGQPTVRLAPIKPALDFERCLQIIDAACASAADKLLPGADAAHSQDYLYGEDGLPR